MRIVETRVLRGPNIHHDRPVLMAVLDLEDLADVSSAALPGFADRLVALLPTLDEHRCSTGRRGGFVERLHEGTYMAHITEHVLIELQCLAGNDVGFGKAREVRGRPGHYRIVCSYLMEPVVRAALPFALDIVERLARGQSVDDFAARLDDLRDLVHRGTLGPSTRAVLDAAAERGIPVVRLVDGATLFQLGWGARARRVRATITGITSHVAVDVASDKQLTKQLLEQAGLPVPRGVCVRNPEDAVDLWRRLDRPVTVKPLDANQGKGVQVNLASESAIATAFEEARRWSADVIVETHIDGDDHRVLVVGDRVVAAARRCPPGVTGDGTSTIRALVERENRDTRRGSGHESALTRIRLDDIALQVLAMQGCDVDTVPARGKLIRLRGNANLSTGGTAEDVTDRLHPDTARACVRAAQVVGLDVAGVDLVCRDVGASLEAQGGAIIEVNAAPGIRMHEYPSSGVPRRAGRAIVDALFPEHDGRIPLIAVTGTNGKTTTTLAIANVLRRAGLRTGVTTTEGVFVDDEALARGDCTGYWSARMLLTAPDVEAAVLETARGGLLRRGLAFDHCDVGVVLNVQGDHLGLDGIDTIADLAWAKGLVARVARRAAVLNADDACCRRIADDLAPGAEVVWFTEDPANATVVRHLAAGGRAVLLRGSAIVLAEGERRMPLADARRLPFTLNGLARHNVLNALACAAAAWAAGYPRETICEGLATFRTTAVANPLRLNLYRVRGATIIVDYAHNAPAYRAIIGTGRLMTEQRLVGVVAAPGDRRPAEFEDIGAACSSFDELVCYDMDDRRGRHPGEVATLVATAAMRAGMDSERVHVIPDARAAVRAALELCSPRDVLVYGCASDLDDLATALAGETIEELVVVERRRAHLAAYADGYGVDPGAARAPSGWDASRPDRRRAGHRPYVVPLHEYRRVGA